MFRDFFVVPVAEALSNLGQIHTRTLVMTSWHARNEIFQFQYIQMGSNRRREEDSGRIGFLTRYDYDGQGHNSGWSWSVVVAISKFSRKW